MSGQYKTPGVYIVEKNAFPNSVVEVATAVPLLIGYTETADKNGQSLSGKPWRITSMAEYVRYFGGRATRHFYLAATRPPEAPAELQIDPVLLGGTHYYLAESGAVFRMFDAMRLFFANGGGACYIVSCGGYDAPALSADALMAGLAAAEHEQEPTMIVAPDMVGLGRRDHRRVTTGMLTHCGITMKNRMAILDIRGADAIPNDITPVIADFRDEVRDAAEGRSYGAAYFPWLRTSLIAPEDIDMTHFDLTDDHRQTLIAAMTAAVASAPEARSAAIGELIAKIGAPADAAAGKALVRQLAVAVPGFAELLARIAALETVMPPSAAIAGLWTKVDNSRGVWKAPANIALETVVEPNRVITAGEQESLTTSPDGVTINAIRSFPGQGTLIWGARTLDGNSLDWRYINVRRTMIMLEESIRLATKAYVFEPNVANTWVIIKSMIRNLLASVWKRGGLAGAVPDDAFSVHVGLGETMTAEDILEGILRVTVLVAISRPAEFIEITFQQQMQKS